MWTHFHWFLEEYHIKIIVDKARAKIATSRPINSNLVRHKRQVDESYADILAIIPNKVCQRNKRPTIVILCSYEKLKKSAHLVEKDYKP